jgi:lipoate-protein ligase B
MARLGTWTTFDCPVEEAKTREAYVWLQEKVSAIGGQVRKVMNPHDFGMYPSFEIDKPSHLEDCDEEDEEMQSEYDAFVTAMNTIEDEFTSKYHND